MVCAETIHNIREGVQGRLLVLAKGIEQATYEVILAETVVESHFKSLEERNQKLKQVSLLGS